jgi:dephospho-CoA kinase
MSEILDIFAEAKRRFRVIGVLGMDSSGKTNFFDTARDQRMMSVTQINLMTQLLRDMIDNGDTEVVDKFAQYGFNVVDSNGKATWDQALLDRLWNEGLTNPAFYKDMSNISFKQNMKVVAGRLKVIIDSLPGIVQKNNLPIFIELPLATDIDYKVYVNEIVSITRPTEYNVDDWYVKAKVKEGNRYLYQFSPYFTTSEDAISFLTARDAMWNEINVQADYVIENIAHESLYAREVLNFMKVTKDEINV